MTAYNWSAGGAGNASVAGNWTPSGVPATGDSVSFSATSVVNCTWNIATVGSMSITSGYTGLIDFATNATIETSLVIASEQRMKSSSSATITFTGTPAHNSNLTYIQNTCTNPFDTTTSRGNLLFKLQGSAVQKIDAGVYPHMQFDMGFRPEFVTPTLTSNKYNVKMLSITIGLIPIAPTSVVPTADDRLMHFVIEGLVNHAGSGFQFNTGGPFSFDAGWGTWTFQAKSSGFYLPISGNPLMNGAVFTWRKMIIDSTAQGSGGFVSVNFGSILSLNDLTVNAGASIKGHDSYGGTIHVINRPTIKGTWGFYPISDGIYHYKGLYHLNVAFGGTGLATVAAGSLLIGGTTQALSTDSNLTFSSNALHTDKGIKITEGADHPIAPATAIGIIWVKSTTPNTLIFTDDAGTDTTLGSGGGGGMTSFTAAGSSGSSQSITNGNTLTIAQGTGITSVASATDTITITNVGVTSNVAGAGIGVSGATGAVTVTNTGVTSNVAGANIAVSGATGAVTVTGSFAGAPAGPIPAWPDVPNQVGKVVFGWLPVTITTGQVIYVPAWIAA